MSRELRTVQQAARRRAVCEQAYRDALIAARAAGHTLTAIGAAAGTGKQAVSQLLKRQAREDT